MRYIPMGETRGPSLGYQPRPRPAPSTLAPLVRKVALVVLLFLLSGCADSARYERCKAESGPKPWAQSEQVLGLMGAIVTLGDPERRAWNHRMNECLATAAP